MQQIYQNEDFIVFDGTDYGGFGMPILTPQYIFYVKGHSGDEVSKIYTENGKLKYMMYKSLTDRGVYDKETFKTVIEQVIKYIENEDFDRRCWCFKQD